MLCLPIPAREVAVGLLCPQRPLGASSLQACIHTLDDAQPQHNYSEMLRNPTCVRHPPKPGAAAKGGCPATTARRMTAPHLQRSSRSDVEIHGKVPQHQKDEADPDRPGVLQDIGQRSASKRSLSRSRRSIMGSFVDVDLLQVPRNLRDLSTCPSNNCHACHATTTLLLQRTKNNGQQHRNSSMNQ